MVAETRLCISADSHIVEPPEVFLGLNKPLHPVRLFTSEEAAMAWLREKASSS